MGVLKQLVLVLHFIGLAAIIGPYLVVRAERRIVPAMIWGARAQVVTGLLLMAFAEMGTNPPNHMKLGVKLGVALAVVACTEMANVRQRKAVGGAARTEAGVGGLVDAAFWLAVVNVAIATLWRSYS